MTRDYGRVRQRPGPGGGEARVRPFRIAAAVVGVYLCVAVVSVWAGGVLAVPVVGPVNVGLVLVLLQFAVTVGVAWRYGRSATRREQPVRTGSSMPSRQQEGRR